MKLLVSGCSFTYGDELEDPARDRWSTHLGKLLDCEVVNTARPGNSNKAIWRATKEKLLQENDFTHCLVLWSAFERVEVLSLDYHLQYDLDDPEAVASGEGEFRTDNPFTQFSPARLDAHPFRLKKHEMITHYNEVYSNEGAILDTTFFMKDVYNTCVLAGITAYGGVFHQAVNFTIAKTFSQKRLMNYGDRLKRINRMYKDMRNGFNDKQKIGFTEPNPKDASAHERPQYLSFNEFTESYKYDKMPGDHPGPEAHKKYAEYLFEEIFNNE